MRFRATKAWRRVLWVVAIVLVLLLAASARLFVRAPTDPPANVDAVIALGGEPGELSAYKAIRLALDGYASVVVVSLGGVPPAPCPRAPKEVKVICFRADPLDTRGEAEYSARLAARNHWTRLMVVPLHTQATRARMLFERCTRAKLYMVPVSDPVKRLPYDVVYEWGALFKALFLDRSC